MIRALALAACLLCVCVVAASAFIRHAQAGAGCESPRACASAQSTRGEAATARPTPTAAGQGGPGAASRDAPAPLSITIARAVHRLAAMLVGVLAILLAAIGWRRAGRGERIAVALALALTLGLAWLGRRTPGALPLVTLGNVVGGFALAATFGWIAGRPARPSSQQSDGRGAGTAAPVWIALALLAAVAATGVMISERGAIDACRAPLCIPAEVPAAEVFDPRVERPADSLAGGQTLQMLHRASAAGFAVLALLAAVRGLAGRASARRWALALLAAVCVQALVGAALAAGGANAALSAGHGALAALLAALLAAGGEPARSAPRA